MPPAPSEPAIAVLLPCYNEEKTISDVVARFRDALPNAAIYVYDNNSSDLTALKARAAAPSWCASRVRARAMSSAACSPI
jgi:glycosyltransferase involved in cell wall biosynthesis